MNKKKRNYFRSFKIDTYLSKIFSLRVFVWIDGEIYEGYIRIYLKSKSKKVVQKRKPYITNKLMGKIRPPGLKNKIY